MSGRDGETGEGPQCMAMVRGHEVLHHLDLDLRSRSGVGEVLRLHHHLTDCFYQEVACLHRLGSARRNLGFLLHHLPRDTTLLPTGPLNLDAYFDHQWRRHVRGSEHLCHHWACCYGIDNLDGPGVGSGSCGHVMEHTDEEELEDSSLLPAVLCVYCISHYHGQDTVRQQV